MKKSTALAKHNEPSEKSHRRGKIHHRGKESYHQKIKEIHCEEKSAASAKTPEAVGTRHRPEESSGQKNLVAVGDLPPLSQRICCFKGILTLLMKILWWRGASPLPRKNQPLDGAGDASGALGRQGRAECGSGELELGSVGLGRAAARRVSSVAVLGVPCSSE